MANRTDLNAKVVHGTNPQFLLEQITRQKIYQTQYWKEQLFAVTAESIVDKAIQLKYVAGSYGGFAKPSKFISLILKMLQIQPEKDIVHAFIQNEDYKYVTAMALFYLRLIGNQDEIYKTLEPFYEDYRKLVFRMTDGTFQVIHMDEFIHDLLNKESVCDIILPRISKRQDLEERGILKLRISALEEDLQKEIDLNENQIQEEIKEVEEVKIEKKQKKHKRHRSQDKDINWRKAVNKYENKQQDKQQNSNQDVPQSQIIEDSVEYWNLKRKELGLKPLQN